MGHEVSGDLPKAYGVGALIFLVCLGSIRLSMRQEFKSQNNPEFDKKLKNTKATLVNKNFIDSANYGELYFDTDGHLDSIKALMKIPVMNEQQKIAFFEAKEGTKKSLMDWKQSYDFTKKGLIYPYVKTVFMDKTK